MGGVYLTTGLVIVLFLLQSRDLGLGQADTLLGDLVLQRLQAERKTGQTMAQRDTADSTGGDENPLFPQLVTSLGLAVSRVFAVSEN